MESKQYWWNHSENTAHEEIYNHIRTLAQNQGWIKEANVRHMRLYSNLNVLSLNTYAYSQNSSINPPHDRLALNIVQAMIDTTTEKIAKAKPRPMFLTEGGDFKLQKKAKQLNKFIDGQMYASGAYEKMQQIFRDAGVFGSGFLKTFINHDNKIDCERVFPGEIMVDESDGIYGKPRTMYQLKVIPKHYAVELYPKFKNQILACKSAESNQPGMKDYAENIWIAEAWHLPSNNKSSDGRHIICFETCTIVDEKWSKTYFPFVKFDWQRRLLGFMGQGLAEQLTGLQVEINKVLRIIQLSFHLVGVPRVFLAYGSEVVKSQLNNEVGSMVWYKGQPPVVYAPAPVSPMLFEYLQAMYQKAFEIAGISQLSASAQKPSGLNSGKALREFSDIESERFVVTQQRWEQCHLDLAEQFIDLAKDISEDKESESYSVLVKSEDKLEKVSWKDVALDSDKYQMQLYPTSFLSKTPSGKLQDVIDLIQAGLMDPKNAMRLLDFPDLKAYTRYSNAPMDDVIKQAEAICEDGAYKAPEPFQDLQSGMQVFQSIYLWAKNNSIPQERLEMLRRWMQEAQLLLQSNMGQGQPGLQGGQPSAAPQQQPVSDLMPVG